MRCAETRPIPGTESNSVVKNNGFSGGNGFSQASTEGAQAEAFLASEAGYRTLFDLEPVAVYSCDAAGIIQQFNRRAAELWGREPAPGDSDERFCGSYKLFRPDGSFMPHEQCPMAEVVNGKLAQVRDGEVLIERPDGSQITVLVNIRPIMSADGEVAGAINCFVDITERIRTETLSREFAAQLADADRRKSEFMAVLAHEFRSPLAAIRAGLKVQRLSVGDAQGVSSANDLIERQVDHLVRLVDDLLDVNLISRGKIQLRRECCSRNCAITNRAHATRTHRRRAARADLGGRGPLAVGAGHGESAEQRL
jgi:PAS domain/His Kinase A (phospho-acceptor) domain